MRYAYYPGCTLKTTSVEYGMSVSAVCSELGIELEEIEDWVCCGATPSHATNHFLSIALPAKSLAAARKVGDSVVIACAACYNRMKVANHEISEDPGLMKRVSEAIGEEYDGSVKVLHLIEVLIKDYGLERIREKVRMARSLKQKDLSNLKVACYYGCLLVRPPKIMQFDDPDDPSSMDLIVEAAGATPIRWEFKTECCGGIMSFPRVEIVHKLVRDILEEAKGRGADLIAVACPLCQSNLDLRQRDVEREFSKDFGIPILFFTQILGLGLGLSRKALGLDKLMVDPIPILKEKGAI
jgi:heterodisulfide reductase subunit B